MSRPGGIMYMQYKNASKNERHTLRVHIAWFDHTPIGVTNDRAYTGDGPVVPTEGLLSNTFQQFGALWQAYYNSDWELKCDSIGYYDNGNEHLLLPSPIFPTLLGGDTTDTSDYWRLERKYRLLSVTGATRHLTLAQVPGQVLRPLSFDVTPTSGGQDNRDRNLIDYLMGNTGGGIVMPDGNYCVELNHMHIWWARKLEPVDAVVGAPGATGPSGSGFDSGCLVYPNGAQICNPDAATVTIQIGPALWKLDQTGLTFPSGYRLETV